MITSNLVFSKWDQIFKDPMTTAAAIDRVVHHAVVLEFVGPSVRAEAAEERARAGQSKRNQTAPADA
jgi:DNA replication protein DnaC